MKVYFVIDSVYVEGQAELQDSVRTGGSELNLEIKEPWRGARVFSWIKKVGSEMKEKRFEFLDLIPKADYEGCNPSCQTGTYLGCSPGKQ